MESLSMESSQSPLVSIILAVRNEQDTIAKCLESLLNQSYSNFELIVVNDGSCDDTERIVRDFMPKDPRIKLINIKHTRDWGCVIPRIIGINTSRSQILFVVDGDAYYDRDYLRACLEQLRDPRVAGAVGKIRVWNPENWVSKARDFHYRGRWNDEENIKAEIASGRIAPWVFRKELYYKVGGYDRSMVYGQDRWLGIKFMRLGYRIAYVPQVEWYHKWEHRPLKIIRSQFYAGRKAFNFTKLNKYDLIKQFYFAGFPWLISISIFYPLFWILVGFHLAPIYFKAIKFLRRADRNRKYAIIFPAYLYIHDIPSSYGFLYELCIRILLKIKRKILGAGTRL